MSDTEDDVQILISRVKSVAQRLEEIGQNASIAGVKMLDGLNRRAVTRSVSTLEDLCNEVESRIERLRGMRHAG